jgi:putative transcriptional regulator
MTKAAVDVGKIRRDLNLTQLQFSRRFHLSLGALRDWEQHRKQPDGAARALLAVIASDPNAVDRALGRGRG